MEVKLTLKQDDGSTKTYKKDGVKARWVRKVLELDEAISKLAKKGSVAVIDAKVDFVVAFFDNETLTADAIWDGLENNGFLDTINNLIFTQIMGLGSNSKSEKSGEK